jgi:hypothetical protein
MKLRILRFIHRDRIALLRRTIRELMPAALDGDGFAINTISRLSNKLKQDYEL